MHRVGSFKLLFIFLLSIQRLQFLFLQQLRRFGFLRSSWRDMERLYCQYGSSSSYSSASSAAYSSYSSASYSSYDYSAACSQTGGTWTGSYCQMPQSSSASYSSYYSSAAYSSYDASRLAPKPAEHGTGQLARCLIRAVPAVLPRIPPRPAGYPGK